MQIADSGLSPFVRGCWEPNRAEPSVLLWQLESKREGERICVCVCVCMRAVFSREKCQSSSGAGAKQPSRLGDKVVPQSIQLHAADTRSRLAGSSGPPPLPAHDKPKQRRMICNPPTLSTDPE